MKFPDKIIFKNITTKFTTWDSQVEKTINLPINVKWVKYDGCLGRMMVDNVYYWTIIPNTFSVRRNLVKHNNITYISFKDYIVIMLTDTPIIPELEIVYWDYFKPLWRDLVFTDVSIKNINNEIKVSAVFELLKVQHPKNATIRIIEFCSSIGIECWRCQLTSNVNLLTKPFHCKRFVSWGNDLFNNAFDRFRYKILCGTEDICNINWELKDYKKLAEFFNQFK